MTIDLESLREVRTTTELRRIAATVRSYAAMLDEASLTNPDVDHRLAGKIADVICELIGRSTKFDNEQRSWIAAAARYFILTKDEASDLAAGGLFDDAAAVVSVCERLGHPELGSPLVEHRV